MVADRARDADAAWLCECLQPRGDVDAVAVDVVAIGDHVSKIDPDAERNALFLELSGVPVDDCPLHLDRAAHRINHARKFREHAVAGGLDNTTAMLLDFRIDKRGGGP